MRIVFNNSVFFFQKNGGISRYFLSIADELIKKNHDIKILAPINKNNLLKSMPQKNKISFYIKRYPGYKFLEHINNNITNYYIKKIKPDIFHETYYSNYIFDNNKSKKIITIYDLIHEKFSNYFSDDKIIKKKEVIMNYDHYICISENTKKDLVNFYQIPEKKISVIHLAGSHYRNINNENKINKNVYGNFFLFVGSRETYKNFNLVVECYRENKDLQNYKIICFGGGKFSKDELKKYKDINVVHVDGDDETLVNLYKQALCVILPSEYEGFGIPMLEAMELGCPVLSSSTPALKETGNEAALYFDPYSSKDLYDKIKLIIINLNFRNELIKKGYQRSKLFTWKKCAEKTLEVYSSVL